MNIKPSIWMYGGVHHDPGSRQRFIEQLAQHDTAPHFVAVEWEQAVFNQLLARRRWLREQLQFRWDFLTLEDHDELARALGWGGDAWADRFLDVDVLWLEDKAQTSQLTAKDSNPCKFAAETAETTRRWLSYYYPLTTVEKLANIAPPPEPRTKQALVAQVSRVMWLEAPASQTNGFERDARWVHIIMERCVGIEGGWIAVVVGWAHVNPAGDAQRLRGLLVAKGFTVNSIWLGPRPEDQP